MKENSPSSAGKLRKIAFVSTNVCAPWEGSEVLWSDTARRLVAVGHTAVANVHGWPRSAPALSGLRAAGVVVQERLKTVTRLRPLALQKIIAALAWRAAPRVLRSWLDRSSVDLVCVSLGSPADNIALMDALTARKTPYVTVFQATCRVCLTK